MMTHYGYYGYCLWLIFTQVMEWSSSHLHHGCRGTGSISSRATVACTTAAAGGARAGSGGVVVGSGRGRAWDATVYLEAEVAEVAEVGLTVVKLNLS